MDAHHDDRSAAARLLASRAGWVFCGFALVGAFYLLLEHRAHAFGVLPYALLLLCPLMHLFMHRGHGHGPRDRYGAGRENDR